MRMLLASLWCLVPLAFIGWHYGPGQEHAVLDDVSSTLQAAELDVKNGKWGQALTNYDLALEHLPESQAASAPQIRLERAKAMMMAQQLPEARGELIALVDELQADPKTAPAFLDDAREALAQAHYYVTWLMRLEGAQPEVWEPEIDAARQSFRLLADSAQKAGDAQQADVYQQDLEAAIRLARLDLAELQALNLPKQCQGCKDCCGKCKGKGKKPGKQGQKKPEDARGASGGPPPDDGGH